ncbi:hypothetical protein CTAYLR_009330 [Chrysophaeum taylorii]|uniref:Calpain catalytic domain-containing protein n=1 Tax=Chrysophaeum taylorii TaxID=2483200 RepID=A0AAD7XPD0_9STRA|nr:hypothetical protein CTAYLR_009330 [Chrysophaeum taylorii]
MAVEATIKSLRIVEPLVQEGPMAVVLVDGKKQGVRNPAHWEPVRVRASRRSTLQIRLEKLDAYKNQRGRRNSLGRPSSENRADAAKLEGSDEVSRGAIQTLEIVRNGLLNYDEDPLDKVYEVLGDSLFVDIDFPPIRREWRRPASVWGSCVLFRNGIDPDDVVQGTLEDCWLMSALGAVAEFPELIERCFVLDSYHKKRCGLYRVRLCHGGRWQTVTLDDFFPYENDAFCYAMSKEKELWPLLLEKAMAKLCGGYDRLSRGFAHDALVELTGSPAIRYQMSELSTQSPNEFFNFLRDADKSDLIMAASTSTNEVEGLVQNHAYSLISVARCPFDEFLGIVQLRNPWSTLEWAGDCSDRDSRWKPAAVKRLAESLRKNPEDLRWCENDGSFWMPFEAFVRHFKTISLCLPHVPRTKHPWFEVRRRCQFVQKEKMLVQIFKLRIRTDSMVYLMAHQLSRIRTAADLAITIFRKVGTLFHYFDSVSPSASRQVTCPRIEPKRDELAYRWKTGEYAIVVYAHAKLRDPVWTDPKKEDPWVMRGIVSEIFDRYDTQLSGRISSESEFLRLKRDLGAAGASGADARTESELRNYLFSIDENKWRRLFFKLGYEGTVLTNRLPVILSVHSEFPDLELQPVLKTYPLDLLAERAQTDLASEDSLLVSRKTWEKKFEILVSQSPGGCGVSVLAKNLTPKTPLNIQVDARKSRNLEAREEEFVVKKLVHPSQTRVMLFLTPSNQPSFFEYTCTYEVLPEIPKRATVLSIHGANFEWIHYATLEEALKKWDHKISVWAKSTLRRFLNKANTTHRAAVLFVKSHDNYFTVDRSYGPDKLLQLIFAEFEARHVSTRFLVDTTTTTTTTTKCAPSSPPPNNKTILSLVDKYGGA